MLVKEQSRLLSLIESGFTALGILVIGDVMLDRSIWGDVDRISPEAPVPVLRSVRTTSAPGGAANVAMNLVGLGVKVAQAGFWGNDVEMRELGALLGPAGVEFSGMILSGHPTISKTRILLPSTRPCWSVLSNWLALRMRSFSPTTPRAR
jgi:D-beta-D-heptose 7-phosphate kinase/D-beta-D-heptose 1-phosphate adenosyltransferase